MANKNTDKESEATFLWNWLGAACKKVLESRKWPEAIKENVNTIYDKSEQKCHPASNQTLYKNILFMIKQSPSVTFSDLYLQGCYTYMISTSLKRKMSDTEGLLGLQAGSKRRFLSKTS